MSISSTIILSLTISIDSFLLCLLNKANKKREFLFIPFVFSLFQSIFLSAGYFIGDILEEHLKSYIKYILFFMFSFMAIKILIDSLTNKSKEDICCLNFKTVITQASLSSIDSLFLGLPLAFNASNHFLLIFISGLLTYIICFVGLLLGKKISAIADDKINIVGSLILFFFAFKSLL